MTHHPIRDPRFEVIVKAGSVLVKVIHMLINR